jgi:hypothetical protein
MIKKIGYCIVSLLLLFIVLSPFRIIYIGLNKGNHLYYLLLIMMVFFSPSLIDLLLNRKDRIFSSENLLIGFKGLVLSSILFLICSFFYGSLISGGVTAAIMGIIRELSIIRTDYANECK